MRQARRGSIDASKNDDGMTRPPSRQVEDEARPGSPLRLSSISFSGKARDQQDPGFVPAYAEQVFPKASPFADAFTQAGQAGPGQGEVPRSGSRGGSRGGARGSTVQIQSLLAPEQGMRLGSPLRMQSPQVPGTDDWGMRNAPPSRERYDHAAGTSDSFNARHAPPSRESARGSSRRGSRTATPPAPVTAWDGAWTLPAASGLGLRSSLDAPVWTHQLPPLDAAMPPSRGRTPPLGSTGPSTSGLAASDVGSKPCLPGQLPRLSSPSKADPATAATTTTSSPSLSSKRHRSPNGLGISQPADVANASLAAIRAGASLTHLTTTRAHVQLGTKELAAIDSLVLGGATLDRKQFGEAVRQLAGEVLRLLQAFVMPQLAPTGTAWPCSTIEPRDSIIAVALKEHHVFLPKVARAYLTTALARPCPGVHAVMKFLKISSPIAAWRMLVDRHILPVANRRNSRFDAYMVAVMGPGVIATVLAWEPHLKNLFTAYAKPEVRNIGAAPAPDGGGAKAQGARKDKSAAREVQVADRHEVLLLEERVPLVSFLKLLQDR